MRIPSMSRSLVVAAALSAAALPVLLPSPTYAAASRDRQPATSPMKTAPSSNPARNTLRAKGPVDSPCFPVPSSPTSTRWK